MYRWLDRIGENGSDMYRFGGCIGDMETNDDVPGPHTNSDEVVDGSVVTHEGL